MARRDIPEMVSPSVLSEKQPEKWLKKVSVSEGHFLQTLSCWAHCVQFWLSKPAQRDWESKQSQGSWKCSQTRPLKRDFIYSFTHTFKTKQNKKNIAEVIDSESGNDCSLMHSLENGSAFLKMCWGQRLQLVCIFWEDISWTKWDKSDFLKGIHPSTPPLLPHHMHTNAILQGVNYRSDLLASWTRRIGGME